MSKTIHNDIKTSTNVVTDTANWLFTSIDNTAVFAIYSTEDTENPTLLYESKGEQGEFEKDYLLKLLEGTEYGKRNDGKPIFINRVFIGSWLRSGNGVRNSNGVVGRGQNYRNVRVLQGQSKRKPTRAFKSVVANLLKIQGTTPNGKREGNLKFSLSKGKSEEQSATRAIYSDLMTKKGLNAVNRDKNVFVKSLNEILGASNLTNNNNRALINGALQNIATKYFETEKINRNDFDRLFDTVYGNAVITSDEEYKNYSDLRKKLGKSKMFIPNAYKGDIADYNELRKRYFGRIKLVSENADGAIADSFEYRTAYFKDYDGQYY